jgi:N6-L-threonylcarbamoyladenine synthase
VINQRKITLNSKQVGGIIPTAAHDFHNASIGGVVSQFCRENGVDSTNPPDLICCTRGPGMVGSLSSSLQLAKGLSVAWNVPLVGVHHMLGHIMVATLPNQESQIHGTAEAEAEAQAQTKTKAKAIAKTPKYPFLSLLCSGGHTLLVLLKSLTDHKIVIDVGDIAVGDSIDKCARELGLSGNLLGKELEKYVSDIPPELQTRFSKINTSSKNNDFEFLLNLPLRGPHNKPIPDKIQFDFASFLSRIQDYLKVHPQIDETARQFLAYKIQHTIFSHIIDRINIALKKHGINKSLYEHADGQFDGVTDFICSGGVASNVLLRQMLQDKLLNEKALNTQFKFHFPDIELCTDNAVMIGVAGIEIFETLRLKSDLSILPIRKWPLDELLTAEGWCKVDEKEFNRVTKYC